MSARPSAGSLLRLEHGGECDIRAALNEAAHGYRMGDAQR